jgi:hypothetical protein
MSQPVISAEHAGITRVVAGLNALNEVVSGRTPAKGVYKFLTGAAALMAVTFASRSLDGATIGFFAEALALATAAFAAFAVVVAFIVPTARVTAQALHRWEVHLARKRADAQFWETARRDPRVMAEYQAAYARESSLRND